MGTRAASGRARRASSRSTPGTARIAEVLAERDDELLADVRRRRRLVGARSRRACDADAGARSCIPCSSAPRSPARASAPLMSAIARAAAELAPATATGRSPRRVFKIERGAGGEKIAYVAHVRGNAERARPRALRTRRRRQGDGARGRSSAGRRCSGSRCRRARSRRSGGSTTSASATAIGEAAAGADRARVPAADARVGRRGGRSRRPRAPARRACATRRAGPADQRPPGRGPNELSVSLYGEVQKEVIQATLADDYGIDVVVPRGDADLHRAPARARRGRRAPARRARTRTWRRSACASSRAADGSGSSSASTSTRRSVPLYVYKTRESFAEHMEQYVRDALARGSLRLAGHRLRRDDDAVRVRHPRRPAVAARAQHGRRLPQAHAARPRRRRSSARAPRLRADGACDARDSRGHDRRRHARALAARRRGRDVVAARRPVDRRDDRAGGTRERPAAAASRADARRRRPRVDLRRLSARARRAAGAEAGS